MFSYSEYLNLGGYDELVSMMNDILDFAEFMGERQNSDLMPFCEHFKGIVVSAWISSLRNGGYQEGDPIERCMRSMEHAVDTFAAISDQLIKEHHDTVFDEEHRLMGNLKIGPAIVVFCLERQEDGTVEAVVDPDTFDNACAAIAKYVTESGIQAPYKLLISGVTSGLRSGLKTIVKGDAEKAVNILNGYTINIINGDSAVFPIHNKEVSDDDESAEDIIDGIDDFIHWGTLLHLPFLEDPAEFTLVVQRGNVVVVCKKFTYDHAKDTWVIVK